MSYQINLYNGVPLVTVDEGTISSEKTTLRLVGKNYAGYGEIQNENFVFLTENFANSAPPPNQLKGQVWYDSFNRKLKFWDTFQWRTTGGAEIGDTAPSNLTTGDFWWKTDSKQLYAFDGINKFILIGPQSVPGFDETSMISVIVIDTEGNRHAIIKAMVAGSCTFIISKDTFTLNSSINPIVGFSFIKSGITLIDSTTGRTTSAYRLWGTASDSDRLDGKLASDFVLASGAVFTNVNAIARFPDSGFTVGNDLDLRIYVLNGSVVTIENQLTNLISFKIKDGLATKETMKIEGDAVVPGITDTYDLGTQALRWRNIWAKNINADNFYGGKFIGDLQGNADNAKRLLYSGDYRLATDINNPFTIVARDANGNFAANIINATATRAYYADLAERYEADSEYGPGTVVIFGGSKEITVTDVEADHRVAGVVSTNPAYLMNDNDPTHPPVALRGKVPVKVIGKVAKGDILITSNIAGHAISAGNGSNIPATAIVAKAIEDKIVDDAGVVMAVVV